MKYLYLIVFIIVGTVLHSQNYEAKYAQYSQYGIRNYSCVLMFNSSEWRYDMKGNIVINITPDSSSDIGEIEETKEKSGGEISSFNYYSLKDNYYLWEAPLLITDMCVIKGDLIKPDWNIISDSTKKIGDYVCTLAECDLCGWKIKAWFTPDIPVSCGPWRLWGLPGLIMNANSEDGDIDIQIVSVKEVSDSPKKPKAEKTVSLEEYKVLSDKASEKKERELNAIPQERTGVHALFKVKTEIRDKCLK